MRSLVHSRRLFVLVIALLMVVPMAIPGGATPDEPTWPGMPSPPETYKEEPGSVSTDDVVFDGHGWGHGIGMSQYGAKGQADEGSNYREILRHYYTGVSVRDIAGMVPGWLLSGDALWVNLLGGGINGVPGATFTARAGKVRVCQNPPPGLSLQQGDRNPYVRVLEQTLRARGVFDGTPNNSFGPPTKEAVETVQANNGLTVDGVVGPDTINVLWPRDAAGDRCFFDVTMPAGDTFSVSAVGRNRCRISVLDARGSCVAAVKGLSPSNRMELAEKTYDGKPQQFADGNIRIRPVGGSFHVLLQTDTETYMRGIAEVPASWPTQVLRAQAVAARSYAMGQASDQGPAGGFDSDRRAQCHCHLYSTVASQVYSGWNREKEFGGTWAAAARDTAGQVMSHPQAGLVTAFYSSSSGGKTENIEEVWGGSPVPYLRSVNDPWARDPNVNPYANWTATLPAIEVAAKLNFGTMTKISVASRNTSGSADVVRFEGDGTVKTMSGYDVRTLLGLRSAYFDVDWEGSASPPGGSGRFIDTGGSVHENDILKLAKAKITLGCNPPTNNMFCPDAGVTRGEMAAFLVRGIQMPPASQDAFVDDGDTVFEGNINQIAARGITFGCNPPDNDRFCPHDTVSRGQMAAFLVRALELPETNEDFFDMTVPPSFRTT
ncbi:MAG: SpoIID/LytB domain-containing protein [Acidimicrobiia bacterium]|nr:SpoIID/LytB domain-containing protein [Acidimicrobiia bacterium]